MHQHLPLKVHIELRCTLLKRFSVGHLLKAIESVLRESSFVQRGELAMLCAMADLQRYGHEDLPSLQCL